MTPRALLLSLPTSLKIIRHITCKKTQNGPRIPGGPKMPQDGLCIATNTLQNGPANPQERPNLLKAALDKPKESPKTLREGQNS